MQKLTSKAFVNTFFRIWDDPDRRICFVLGAGASKSSGIRTGGELAKQWLDEIKDTMSDEPGAFDDFLKEKNIDEKNPAISYPLIYSENYKFDKDSGFACINKEMEGVKPGYGYSVLAQMIAASQHNIVITTNFDNLTEEALYTYTSGRPLVCGHESLAVFAKPSVKRPLIVKIHRDRYFNPQSEKEEVNEINKLWIDALNNIFNASTPVFIGYGGNDGSMMGYMEQLKKINNLFWCEIKGVSVSKKVEKLLEKHNGNLVEVDGFDELMFLLQSKLSLKVLNEDIIHIAQEREKNYRDTFEKISKKQLKSNDKNVQQAATTIINQTDVNNWWFWVLKAQTAEKDEKMQAIYLEGLKTLPDSSELNGTYAIFLYLNMKNYDEAEKYYLKSLKLDPNNSITNLNYGIFLYNGRKNYDEAEKYLSKALQLDPKSSNINSNYANFLNVIRKDYEEAEKFYKRALELDPKNSTYNSDYANFLNDIKKDYNEAEKFYKIALLLDSKNANVKSNYGNFLYNIRKNYDEAEKYYQSALELDSSNSNINGIYANFLYNVRKDNNKAEKYYKRSLELDASDVFTNGNYAIFLYHAKKEYEEAEKYFKHSLQLDPHNGIDNGNYAGLLFFLGKEDEALIYLTSAFKNCKQNDLLAELWFYKYAHIENDRSLSLYNLQQLICDKKVRSLNFNLQNNVDRAIEDGHPNPELLLQIADIITKDAPADEFCAMSL